MSRIVKTPTGKVLRESSASGTRGMLLRTRSPEKYFFRIYKDDGTFDDYRLLHSDLAITINADYEASFYENEQGEKFLDHSPETLGWKVIETES